MVATAAEPVLLLLHGLGGTGEVWQGLRRLWDGPSLAPDLPGHGRAAPLESYTFAALASAVAAELDPALSYDVVGHSLGGVVALVLAASGLRVRRVVGVGIKASWSEDDLARAAALAARPAVGFPTCAQAADRFLAVAGLRGLVAPDDPRVDRGLREQGGEWTLALDSRAFGVGAPDLPALLASARAPVLLVRGEHDPMVSDAELAALGVPHRTLPDLGHSPHVEDPAALLVLLERA